MDLHQHSRSRFSSSSAVGTVGAGASAAAASSDAAAVVSSTRGATISSLRIPAGAGDSVERDFDTDFLAALLLRFLIFFKELGAPTALTTD